MRWLLCLALSLLACQRPEARPLRVAAAADLSQAFAELKTALAPQIGRDLVVSFGSSGLLSRQIVEGAPFDLFAAAGPEYIDRVAASGRLVPGSRQRYARGRLVLWTRDQGPQVHGLADLVHPAVRRIAVANPEHAPYGRAAVQALVRAGIYEQVRGKLVLGENVRQALQYAETGNVEVAVVARALVGEGGRWVEVPEALHDPLDQELGVIRGGDEAGAGLLAGFLRGKSGQDLLRRHGFVVPP